MKTIVFVSSLLLAIFLIAPAHAEVKDVPQPAQPGQVPPTPPPGPPIDPAKVAEYQKRFQQGYDLQQAGQLQQARAIYDGILAEQPDAKRSLLEAGRISLKLNDPTKADDYLSKLHALVPDFPEAIELLIQANQALKRDIKVSNLIKQFQTLHSTTQDPKFAQSLNFVREQIKIDADNSVTFIQYFDYTQAPFFVWQAQLMDGKGGIKRQLNLFYDAKAGSEIEAKDPKLTNASQFILLEDIVKDGKVDRIDAYFQMFTLPEYKKVRNSMLAIFAGAYKPVYSQPMGDAAAPAPTAPPQ